MNQKALAKCKICCKDLFFTFVHIINLGQKNVSSGPELISEKEFIEFRTISVEVPLNVIPLLFLISNQQNLWMFMLFHSIFLDGRVEGEKILHLRVPRIAAEKSLISASF